MRETDAWNWFLLQDCFITIFVVAKSNFLFTLQEFKFNNARFTLLQLVFLFSNVYFKSRLEKYLAYLYA